jgi:DmsE family decaheme c-type cytochrome
MSPSRLRLYRPMAFAAVGAACLLLAASAAAQQPQQSPASAQGGVDYVGEATCLTCHQNMEKGYRGTAHGRAWDSRTPAATGHGCEACHGPGRAHVDAGGDRTKIRSFKALEPTEASSACTTCHNRGTHLLWSSSAHESRQVGCLSCHAVHSFRSEKGQLKEPSEVQLCAQCHRDKTLRLLRSSHMPVQSSAVREAHGVVMTCSSCHNPHGSANVRMLRVGTDVNESCTSCHAEKRGPFLWEHAPVVENCVTCHDPHGTNNDRMLVAKLPMLCQRCHVTSRHPATPYDLYQLRNTTGSNRIAGRGCVNCHQNIHGSNSPSGEAFIR